MSATLYIDNNAALASLINGDPASTSALYLIAALWYLVAAFDIALWAGRVESARNISDIPTRGRRLPSPIMGNASPHPLQEITQYYDERSAANDPTPNPMDFDSGPYSASLFG